MSREKHKPPIVKINKTELKCIIIRHFKNQKEFCKAAGINHGTMRHYIIGKNMPKIDHIVAPIMADLGYNPDGSRIIPTISPDTKLQIAANHG